MTKNEMQAVLEMAGYEFVLEQCVVTKYVAYPPIDEYDFLRVPCVAENNRGRCLKKTWEHYESS